VNDGTRVRIALPGGHIDFFNQTWLRYVGLRLETIQGWNWTCAIHLDDVEGIVLTLYSPLEYKKLRCCWRVAGIPRDSALA
jgi:hypothetical protein